MQGWHNEESLWKQAVYGVEKIILKSTTITQYPQKEKSNDIWSILKAL